MVKFPLLFFEFSNTGGIKSIPNWCLKELRKICDKKKILLILDEVQCGIGRSGNFFAFENSKIKPDIVPIAKGIGGGFRLSGRIPSNVPSLFQYWSVVYQKKCLLLL